MIVNEDGFTYEDMMKKLTPIEVKFMNNKTLFC